MSFQVEDNEKLTDTHDGKMDPESSSGLECVDNVKKESDGGCEIKDFNVVDTFANGNKSAEEKTHVKTEENDKKTDVNKAEIKSELKTDTSESHRTESEHLPDSDTSSGQTGDISKPAVINENTKGGEENENEEDEFCSGESGSEDEYKSAEEGEEIQTDAQNLREMEDSLTDEEKEERRAEAQKQKEEGNNMFRSGSYKTAIRMYSRALRMCPLKFQKDRAIMYSNRGACKMRLEEYEEAIRDCSKALDLHPQYLKTVMRRAELYEKTDKLDEALADYQKVLELDPSQHTARAACVRLPDQIKERNEKLKEEMMGKLKELGNMVLRPFGLSTNNFKLNQDPNTGGYSVNFVQSPEQ